MTRSAQFSRRAAALLLAALPAAALTAAAPHGARAAEAPVLTVTGAVEGGEQRFTRAQLAALPRAEYVTSTVWTEGVRRFSGVPLHELLKAVGAQGGSLHMVAVNDYAVQVPLADAAPQGALLAYEVDGKPMSVREKGPVWLIYPYDSDGKWRSEAVYARSIWQLTRIDVRD